MTIRNKLRAALHQYYKKLEIQDHLLTYLFLEITKKCNLNCLHCGSDCISLPQSHELTTQSWIKIVNYVREHFSKSVVFVITGGEPLLHKGLTTIGKAIIKNEMRWGTVTNGMLLTSDKMKELVDAGIYSITISLDGMEKAHNKLRNHRKAFEKVNNALHVIGKTDLAFKDAVTCVYPENLNQLDDIAKLLIDKGFTSWRLFRIFPSGRAAKNAGILLTYRQTWHMIDWIRQHRKAYKKQGLTIDLSCEGWLPFDIDRQVRSYPFFCRAGINIASILSDGTITGCSNNAPSFYAGNILKDDFATVWNQRFDVFRKREWIENTKCNTCEFVKKCCGGSIHLWELGSDKPKFCYAKDITNGD